MASWSLTGARWGFHRGRGVECDDADRFRELQDLRDGEYTFKYRLRANMAGAFRVGPAVLQLMYAPEFTAYSAGHRLEVEATGQSGSIRSR